MSAEAGPQRWIAVILDDISRGGRAAARFLGHWSREVAAWFRFVHYRRTDDRFPVLGDRWRMGELFAIAASAVLFLVLVVDPLFIYMLEDRSELTMSIFGRITEVGRSTWALYLVGAALLVLSVTPRSQFKRRRRVDLHDLPLAAWFIFTTVAFSGLLSMLAKNAIGRARPPVTPEGSVWFSQPFGHAYDFASFPSGHATTAGALAMALALLAPRLKVFILLAGGWIAFSRPVLGVHYPSDIVAGFTFGLWFTWVYARSFARKRLLFAFRTDGNLQLDASLTRGRRLAAPKQEAR